MLKIAQSTLFVKPATKKKAFFLKLSRALLVYNVHFLDHYVCRKIRCIVLMTVFCKLFKIFTHFIEQVELSVLSCVLQRIDTFVFLLSYELKHPNKYG